MRRRHVAVAASATIALAGCGSASHTSSQAYSEQVVRICGTLRTRLHGIAILHAIDDPQPATLRGIQPGRRTAQASIEAALASHETVPRLRAVGAPPGSIAAVTRAERSYARYADVTKSTMAPGTGQGLHIEAGYLMLAATEERGCAGPPR